MAPRYRIHGRIAAEPRHTLAPRIVEVRHNLVRRDIAHNRALYVAHVAIIAAAVALAALAVIVA